MDNVGREKREKERKFVSCSSKISSRDSSFLILPNEQQICYFFFFFLLREKKIGKTSFFDFLCFVL